MQYSRELKKQLCKSVCINGFSTIKTAQEYDVPLKTLENWITAFNKDNHCFDPVIETTNDFKYINNPDNANYNDVTIKKETLLLILLACPMLLMKKIKSIQTLK